MTDTTPHGVWQDAINGAVTNAINGGVWLPRIVSDLDDLANYFRTHLGPPVNAPVDDALTMAAKIDRTLEGFRPYPYQDSAGVWTIGYGSIRINGAPVTASTPPVTEGQALAMMMDEMRPIAAAVDAHVPPTATVCQRAALYSFAYNEGVNALLGSTLLARFRAGDIPGAAAQFAAWNKIHDPVTHQLVDCAGLTNRRKAEVAVFLGAPPA